MRRFFILLFVLGWMTFPIVSLYAEIARTEMIHGTIELIDAKGNKSFLQQGEMSALPQATRILTGANDNVEINLAQSNYIRVVPESEIEFETLSENLVRVVIHRGDVLAKIKALAKNPRFIFVTPHGEVEITGPKGTHSLIWTEEDSSGAGVAFGSIAISALGQSVDVPSHHFVRFDKTGTSMPKQNNNNIGSRINQVSVMGDSKSATSILEGSHRRSRSR